MVAVADYSVSGTRKRHLRRLKGGVVSHGERAVCGKSGDSRVVKVSLDDRSDVIKLLLARLMCPDAVRVL
jgi:hypothetical protein